ncbi:AMP-binding protein [Streptomyces sp. NBC_00435]|uniref:AMP-binding protein n=1 Tax=Streptomyces sp. NBC_00435 TaxID=2903649 RepID=UPI002E1A36CE
MSNLATNLKDAAGQYPQRPAIRAGAHTLTYGDLDELSARVAGGLLAHGVRPGDRVGLVLPAVAAFPVLYYGVLRIGAVVVTVDPGLGFRTVRRRLRESGVRLVFASHDPTARAAHDAGPVRVPIGSDILTQLAFWPQHFDVAQRADEDIAVVHHPAGASGSLTPTELSHGAMRADAFTAAISLLDLAPDATLASALPVSHPAGQSCGLNATILAGACLTLLPGTGHPAAAAPNPPSTAERPDNNVAHGQAPLLGGDRGRQGTSHGILAADRRTPPVPQYSLVAHAKALVGNAGHPYVVTTLGRRP